MGIMEEEKQCCFLSWCSCLCECKCISIHTYVSIMKLYTPLCKQCYICDWFRIMIPFPCTLSQEPSLSGVGMATLSTRTMDVLNFVGVVGVPTIVSVVDERFQFYQHIHYPSVAGATQFLTSTLPRSIFTAVRCGQ